MTKIEGFPKKVPKNKPVEEVCNDRLKSVQNTGFASSSPRSKNKGDIKKRKSKKYKNIKRTDKKKRGGRRGEGGKDDDNDESRVISKQACGGGSRRTLLG